MKWLQQLGQEIGPLIVFSAKLANVREYDLIIVRVNVTIFPAIVCSGCGEAFVQNQSDLRVWKVVCTLHRPSIFQGISQIGCSFQIELGVDVG